MLLKRLLLYSFILTLCLPATGQNLPEITSTRNDPYTRFTSFTPWLGNDCGTIVDIYQDHYGYIWLAGTRCLSRFDGNIVKKYTNDWTPGSLPASQTTCIESGNDGRLFIGTSGGPCYYDYEKDVFTSIFMTDSLIPDNDSLYVLALKAEGDSLLWMMTLQGYLWKIDSRSFKVLNQYCNTGTRQPYYHYFTIFRDHDGTLWIGGRNMPPQYLDKNKDRIVALPFSDLLFIPGMKREADVSYYFIDSEDNFWIAGLDGIYLFNKQDTSFHRFLKSSSWSMLESYNGKLWFGTSTGLAQYNPDDGEMILYSHNEEDKASLAADNIYKLFEDSYKQIWVSTSKGVSVYKPESKGVDYLFHIPGTKETPASSSVTDLVQDPSGKVWIATSGKGIDRYDPENHTIEHFNTNNIMGLPSDKVSCLLPAGDGSIYCGLWAGLGFGRLYPKSHSFSLYTYQKESTHSDWYNDLTFGKDGLLYLGFWGGKGLTQFDTAREEFGKSLMNKFQEAFLSRLITCLHYDSKDRLWMGTTQSGLHLYLPKKDTSVCYYSKVNPEHGIDPKKIYDIKESKNGDIWIGANGLYYYDSEKSSFHEISFESLAIDPDVYALLPVNDRDVWLLTNHGVFRYNLQWKRFSDQSEYINLYFSEDAACALELSDGRLMFGGENGIAIVEPKNMETEPRFPSVFLSSMSVFDQVKIPVFGNKKDVDLNYDENFFSIQIGSDVWGRNIPFHFFTMLEGFDQDWKELPLYDRTVRFTNVPSGDFDFMIKVEDAQGEKVFEDIACRLTIIPPLWLRWWFISLLAIIALSIIGIIWWNRYRSMRLSLMNVELNQKLLRLQMNPHFIFNSLFAIQNYIYSNQTHQAGNYLSDFAKLIRLILDNSRHEYIGIDKELECIELYLKLQKLRFDDKFSYMILTSQELQNGDISIPPMLAQPFLENAIEHGLKNLDKHGEIKVEYEVGGDMLNFTVTDNGIGLTAAEQLKEKRKPGHESLAISICKNRLNILHKKGGNKIDFSISEIQGKNGEIEGTKVSFNIPFRN